MDKLIVKVVEKILKAVITISLMVFSYYTVHSAENINLLPNQIAITAFFCSGVTLFLVSKKGKYELLTDQLITNIIAIVGYNILNRLFGDKSAIPNAYNIVTSLIFLTILSIFLRYLEKLSKESGKYTYIGFYISAVALAIALFTIKIGALCSVIVFMAIFMTFNYYGYKKLYNKKGNGCELPHIFNEEDQNNNHPI